MIHPKQDLVDFLIRDYARGLYKIMNIELPDEYLEDPFEGQEF